MTTATQMIYPTKNTSRLLGDSRMANVTKRDVLVVAVAIFAAVGVSWQGIAQQLFIYPTKCPSGDFLSRMNWLDSFHPS
jgi:hypothetical protein